MNIPLHKCPVCNASLIGKPKACMIHGEPKADNSTNSELIRWAKTMAGGYTAYGTMAHKLQTVILKLILALEKEITQHEFDLRNYKHFEDSYIKEHGVWGNCTWRIKYEQLVNRLKSKAPSTNHSTACLINSNDILDKGNCTCGAHWNWAQHLEKTHKEKLAMLASRIQMDAALAGWKPCPTWNTLRGCGCLPLFACQYR